MKKVIIGLTIAILAVAIGLFLNLTREDTPVNTQENENLGGGMFLRTSYLNNNPSTTTPTTLATDSASSSLVVFTQGADIVDFNIYTESTTTVPTSFFTIEASRDQQDWFGEDGTTVDSTTHVTHGADIVVHEWAVATTGATYKTISIEPVASRFIRVNIAVEGATTDIWASLVARDRI